MSATSVSGTSEPAPRPLRRGERWLLATILVAGFALRLWGASAGLDLMRFFDERYSLRNVAAILLAGDAKPANAFYGSLSYLPHTGALWVTERLHELTGAEVFAIRDRKAVDGWSATAYFVVRLVNVIAGTLAAWLAFAIGRRVYDPAIGLWTATLVTAFPRNVLSAIQFKPDILVALFVALAFLWSLEAARDPRPRRVLLAAGGVGLAVAAKYTGVGVAIPLVVGVLWGRWRRLRPWLLLAGAGLFAIALFFVLNPHFDIVLDYLPRLWNIMESKGEAEGGSHVAVLVQEVQFLVLHHGWPVALLALAGTLGWAWRLVPRRNMGPNVDDASRVHRRDVAMLLSYVVGYSLLYAGATSLFRGQNFVPLATFTSLAAAVAGMAAWRWLAARWRPLADRRLATALGLVVAGLVMAPTVRWVYQTVTPRVVDRAETQIRQSLRPLEWRVAFYDQGVWGLRPSNANGHELPVLPGELAAHSDEALDLTDLEVLFASRLERERYARRLDRGPVRLLRFDPEPFVTRGDGLVLVLHPWRPDGDPVVMTSPAPGVWTATLDPPLGAEEAVSFGIFLPRRKRDSEGVTATVDDRPLELMSTKRSRRRMRFQSERLHLPAGHREVRLELSVPTSGKNHQITVQRWLPYDGSRIPAVPREDPRR